MARRPAINSDSSEKLHSFRANFYPRIEIIDAAKCDAAGCCRLLEARRALPASDPKRTIPVGLIDETLLATAPVSLA